MIWSSKLVWDIKMVFLTNTNKTHKMFFRLWGKMCNYYDFSPTHPPNISVANGPNLKKNPRWEIFPISSIWNEGCSTSSSQWVTTPGRIELGVCMCYQCDGPCLCHGADGATCTYHWTAHVSLSIIYWQDLVINPHEVEDHGRNTRKGSW